MTTRLGTHARIVLLALAAALAPAVAAAPASADRAYDKVAAAYAEAGGQLDPCAFTQRELEAAVRGIPPQIRDVVPDITRAMLDGIAAHMRGDCRDGRADAGSSGGAAVPPAGTTPTTAAPPVTTPAAPTTTATTPADTTAAAPAPPTTTPGAPSAPAAPATAPVGDERDLAPLWIALVAVGALLLLGLLTWGWARMRGWDPAWVARTRHAWGEAAFRTTGTWAEFTDWLRLGR